MTIRQTAATGGAVGLLVSGAVLTLLWFGVAGVLRDGRADLMYVFWPSSAMLTVGWCSTVHGIMTTISSVAINCLLYIGIALLLRSCIQGSGFRICIAASCVSAASLFVLWNTALVVWKTRQYCVILFTLPLTHKIFILPGWMWGPIPLSVSTVSTLAAVVLWISLLVKHRRIRHFHS